MVKGAKDEEGISGCDPNWPLGIKVAGSTPSIELVAIRSSVPALLGESQTVK